MSLLKKLGMIASLILLEVILIAFLLIFQYWGYPWGSIFFFSAFIAGYHSAGTFAWLFGTYIVAVIVHLNYLNSRTSDFISERTSTIASLIQISCLIFQILIIFAYARDIIFIGVFYSLMLISILSFCVLLVLDKIPIDTSPQALICSECGAEMPMDSTKCPVCGEDIERDKITRI